MHCGADQVIHSQIHGPQFASRRDRGDVGRVLLQIDTYGRETREMPGKKSQTIQLDRDGATALFNILKQEFNLN
jgi:hypothetical protein